MRVSWLTTATGHTVTYKRIYDGWIVCNRRIPDLVSYELKACHLVTVTSQEAWTPTFARWGN